MSGEGFGEWPLLGVGWTADAEAKEREMEGRGEEKDDKWAVQAQTRSSNELKPQNVRQDYQPMYGKETRAETSTYPCSEKNTLRIFPSSWALFPFRGGRSQGGCTCGQKPHPPLDGSPAHGRALCEHQYLAQGHLGRALNLMNPKLLSLERERAD